MINVIIFSSCFLIIYKINKNSQINNSQILAENTIIKVKIENLRIRRKKINSILFSIQEFNKDYFNNFINEIIEVHKIYFN